jgi:hypothetical protein
MIQWYFALGADDLARTRRIPLLDTLACLMPVEPSTTSLAFKMTIRPRCKAGSRDAGLDYSIVPTAGCFRSTQSPCKPTRSATTTTR